eukprot:TRINITY_DN11676_c0_g2_i2.p1 TRINITY_DN11676_c0_g2~~TRINITY_DN11676_c0_g2_i2.p1  ORF type:complete len:802 (+),score=213.56 TRINITY_DN11676_c0_g2_i2:94-2499(+)
MAIDQIFAYIPFAEHVASAEAATFLAEQAMSMVELAAEHFLFKIVPPSSGLQASIESCDNDGELDDKHSQVSTSAGAGEIEPAAASRDGGVWRTPSLDGPSPPPQARNAPDDAVALQLNKQHKAASDDDSEALPAGNVVNGSGIHERGGNDKPEMSAVRLPANVVGDEEEASPDRNYQLADGDGPAGHSKAALEQEYAFETETGTRCNNEAAAFTDPRNGRAEVSADVQTAIVSANADGTAEGTAEGIADAVDGYADAPADMNDAAGNEPGCAIPLRSEADTSSPLLMDGGQALDLPAISPIPDDDDDDTGDSHLDAAAADDDVDDDDGVHDDGNDVDDDDDDDGDDNDDNDEVDENDDYPAANEDDSADNNLDHDIDNNHTEEAVENNSSATGNNNAADNSMDDEAPAAGEAPSDPNQADVTETASRTFSVSQAGQACQPVSQESRQGAVSAEDNADNSIRAVAASLEGPVHLSVLADGVASNIQPSNGDHEHATNLANSDDGAETALATEYASNKPNNDSLGLPDVDVNIRQSAAVSDGDRVSGYAAADLDKSGEEQSMQSTRVFAEDENDRNDMSVTFDASTWTLTWHCPHAARVVLRNADSNQFVRMVAYHAPPGTCSASLHDGTPIDRAQPLVAELYDMHTKERQCQPCDLSHPPDHHQFYEPRDPSTAEDVESVRIMPVPDHPELCELQLCWDVSERTAGPVNVQLQLMLGEQLDRSMHDDSMLTETSLNSTVDSISGHDSELRLLRVLNDTESYGHASVYLSHARLTHFKAAKVYIKRKGERGSYFYDSVKLSL